MRSGIILVMQMCDIYQEVCPFNRERGTRDLGFGTRDNAMTGRADAPSSADLMTERADDARVPLSVFSAAPTHSEDEAERGREGQGGGVVHGAYPTSEPAFQPRAIASNIKLTDLLYVTQEQFSAAFKGSAVKRAKRRGLLRNAAVALVGRDDPEVIAALEHALDDPEELVRKAAKWVLTSNKSVQ